MQAGFLMAASPISPETEGVAFLFGAPHRDTVGADEIDTFLSRHELAQAPWNR